MHRRHRVPSVGHVADAELGGQLAEPCHQHGRIFAGKLPGHPGLVQVAVRVLHCKTVVLPVPPSPHKATIRGPRRSPSESRSSSSASSSSRPARNSGRGASRTGFPVTSRRRSTNRPIAVPPRSATIDPYLISRASRARKALRRAQAGGPRRRHAPVDHPGGDPPAGCGDGHIPSPRPPVHPPQRLLQQAAAFGLLHQGAQLSLGVRVLLQHIRRLTAPAHRSTSAARACSRSGPCCPASCCRGFLPAAALPLLCLLGIPRPSSRANPHRAASHVRDLPRSPPPSARPATPARPGSPPASSVPSRRSPLTIARRYPPPGVPPVTMA